MVEKVKPYRVQVAEKTLQDLRERLERTRWPNEPQQAGWNYGIPSEYMRRLVEYWHTQFDWRAQERFINSFANYRTDVDGIGIHFIHERGRGPSPLPLLITHRWPTFPESILIMSEMLPVNPIVLRAESGHVSWRTERSHSRQERSLHSRYNHVDRFYV